VVTIRRTEEASDLFRGNGRRCGPACRAVSSVGGMPRVPAVDVLWNCCGEYHLMRLKTWIVAALGLGSLVGLIAISMSASSRKAEAIYAQLEDLNSHHRQVDETLRRLRSDVNLSGIFVRDYLLDVARERAPEYREQIAEFRRTTLATIDRLKILIKNDQQIAALQAKLEDYWAAFDPLFDWTTGEKIARSASFLRNEVVPRREAALAIAREIEELNNANLAAQRDEVARRHNAFRQDLQRFFWQTVLLGLIVAMTVVARLRVLEHRSEHAEQQMRALSQQVVNAQEEERKHLARELHDHIAQVLTGLRMELGSIERTTGGAAAITECKRLVDDLFLTVRNLALGLRPSMLDDFGLRAALEWHARDCMSRSAVNVDLATDGDLESLPDKHRTCVYRVVQEATTNAIRHAHASNIRVRVTADRGQLKVTVSDDGVGIDPGRRRNGLGLRGMEERAKELNGSMTIAPDAKRGTTVSVRLPLPVEEAPRARAAR
jgi:signal transduction histidine kinase